jgi:hypothetical protein
VPSYLELSSLVDYGQSDPAIDEGTFTSPPVGNPLIPPLYWTASLNAAGKNAWTIDSVGGLPLAVPALGVAQHEVRCVKGSLTGEVVKSESCNTVSDSRTGLMWTRFVPGSGYTWSDAANFCDGLDHAGFKDWRLPSLKEIQTIITTNAAPPLIDESLFGATPSDYHWTSTASTVKLTDFGAIDFKNGLVLGFARTTVKRARCVRVLN